MSQIIGYCFLSASIGLFIGILIGKGADERKRQRQQRAIWRQQEEKQPRAIRMDNYKKSS